jgi:predicted dehydrogenase
LITYPDHTEPQPELHLVGNKIAVDISNSDRVRIGVLGAGSFANSTLLPALKRAEKVDLIAVSAATGAHARHAADKFGFRDCVTDEETMLRDPELDAIVIATRHHLHAQQIIGALTAGKHVFCEKPLCLHETELHDIISVHRAQTKRLALTVGFNRRFSPMAVKLKRFITGVGEPLAMHYRVNAGFISSDHWINDPEQGGGRILGEVCHFIDFLTFLAGNWPVEVRSDAVTNLGRYSADNVVISMRFSNGSQGTITYVANGDRSYSKERLEVFGGGCVAVLDDFRVLELVRNGRTHTMRSRFRQDKGHRAGLQAFFDSIRNGGEPPIPFSEILTVTLATFAALESLRTGHNVPVDASPFLHPHTA